MTYFVLRYLGYDVALYDGSFVEWDEKAEATVAARPARPARWSLRLTARP